jgi:hypothetical protein
MLGELPEHHHQPLLLEQYLEYLSILPLQRPLKLYEPIGIHHPHLLRQLRLLNIGHLLTLGLQIPKQQRPNLQILGASLYQHLGQRALRVFVPEGLDELQHNLAEHFVRGFGDYSGGVLPDDFHAGHWPLCPVELAGGERGGEEMQGVVVVDPRPLF